MIYILRYSKYFVFLISMSLGSKVLEETINGKMEGVKTTFPPEWDPHTRTYMAWPDNPTIWRGVRKLKAVQRDIVRIAQAIVPFEPVTVLASPGKVNEAKKALGENVTVINIPVNDLWARDTLPVFTFESTEENGTKLVGVDFNFNGWGKKQRHEADSQVARKVLTLLNLERKRTDLVTEGGSLETDGAGTLMITESSIVNKNRNPGKSKQDIENKLKEILGIRKVIWFKGVAGKDITDAHVDSIVRFVAPGKVIITRPPPQYRNENDVWTRASNQALQVLEKETDADGNRFNIVKLYEPNIELPSDDFVSSYVNFYVVNGGVIIPRFGDKDADAAAIQALQNAFPDRKIVSVRIDALASGGGGIHCATHDLPYYSNSVSVT